MSFMPDTGTTIKLHDGRVAVVSVATPDGQGDRARFEDGHEEAIRAEDIAEILPADRVFGRGQEEEARKVLRNQDARVLFEGRTVLIECVFRTIVHPNVLSTRLREACAGPLLRMTVGGIERRKHDLAYLTKSFINTDESVEDVGARVITMKPKPERVTAGLVDTREAAAIWAEVHRMQDGGD